MIEHDLLCPQGSDDGLPCYCTLISTVREEQARECGITEAENMGPLHDYLPLVRLVAAVLAWQNGERHCWRESLTADWQEQARQCATDLGFNV